jgi:hypothetical protein
MDESTMWFDKLPRVHINYHMAECITSIDRKQNEENWVNLRISTDRVDTNPLPKIRP